MTEQEYIDREEKLRPKLTDEFLATLAEAAEISMFDYYEVDGFVSEMFQLAGKEVPEKYRRENRK